MNRIFAALLFVLVTVSSHSVMAERYMGLGVGTTSFSLTPLYGSDSLQDDTALRFLYGMRNNNSGFELDVSLADYSWSILSESKHSTINIVLSGVGYLPIGDSFSLFGKVGANFWSTNVDFFGTTYEGDDGVGIALSGGLDAEVSERFHLTVEYQYLPGLSDGIDDGDISQLFINALYYY